MSVLFSQQSICKVCRGMLALLAIGLVTGATVGCRREPDEQQSQKNKGGSPAETFAELRKAGTEELIRKRTPAELLKTEQRLRAQIKANENEPILAARAHCDIAMHFLMPDMLGSGKEKEAIDHFDKALALNAELSVAHFGKGIVLYNQAVGELALRRALGGQLTHNPDGSVRIVLDSAAYDLLTNALSEFSEFKRVGDRYTAGQGYSHYRVQLSLYPTVDEFIDMTTAKISDHLIRQGFEMEQAGKTDSALSYYDQAYGVRKTYSALFNKGNCLFKLGQSLEAIACFDTCIEMNPKIKDAWGNKGYVFQEGLGKFEEAIPYYKKVLEIDPNNQMAKFNQQLCEALVREGASLEDYRKWQEAVRKEKGR